MTAAVMDPFGLIGTTLAGKYRVERVLGEGGFGLVYAGTHLMLGERVAIKFIKPESGSTKINTAAFLREARLLFSLTHPSIVRMYDVGDVKTPMGDAPYVVLEFVEGRSLHDEITRRLNGAAPAFSLSDLRLIFEPAMDALAFAHAREIVHRDIKPPNIMVVTDPHGHLTAKLLDFGMAAAAPGGVATTGGLTPRYAAPEQWSAAYGKVGPLSDVFAMGLCLEEAATLRRAVEGTSFAEIVASTTSETRGSRIAEMRPDLPLSLAAWVVRATRVAPSDRFASAQLMLAELRSTLGGASRTSHLPSMTPSVPVPRASAAPLLHNDTIAHSPSFTVAHAAPARPAKKNKIGAGWILAGILGVVLLFALVIVGGGVGYYVYTTRGPTPTSDTSTPPPPTATVTATATTTATATPTATPIRSSSTAPTPTSKPTPSPTPSPSPTPTPPPPAPDGQLAFFLVNGTNGGLSPDANQFVAVVNGRGPELRQCFDGLEDAYASSVRVTIRADGARGVNAIMRRNGVDDVSTQSQRAKNCILSHVAVWTFPKPKGDPGFSGTPFLTFNVGLQRSSK